MTATHPPLFRRGEPGAGNDSYGTVPGMTFEWTAELAADTPPFCGEGSPIATEPVDAKALFAPIATALAPQQAPAYRPRESLITFATSGQSSGFSDEADAVILLGAVGRKGASRGQLTMLDRGEAEKVVVPAVDCWVQVYGLPDAIEILGNLGAWRPYPVFNTGHTVGLARLRLRQHLAHAPDYDAALARAAKLLDEGLASCRGRPYNATAEVLAYLFPDHRPFFAAACAAIAAASFTSQFLIGAITSVDEYRQIPSRGAADVDENALVIPRSLREQGLPILLELVEKGGFEKPTFVRALGAYATHEAAVPIARFVEKKALIPLVTAYFAKHRSLVENALAPLTSSKKKAVRDGAVKVLAALA